MNHETFGNGPDFDLLASAIRAIPSGSWDYSSRRLIPSSSEPDEHVYSAKLVFGPTEANSATVRLYRATCIHPNIFELSVSYRGNSFHYDSSSERFNPQLLSNLFSEIKDKHDTLEDKNKLPRDQACDSLEKMLEAYTQ